MGEGKFLFKLAKVIATSADRVAKTDPLVLEQMPRSCASVLMMLLTAVSGKTLALSS